MTTRKHVATRRPWTPEFLDQIATLYNANVRLKEIARTIGYKRGGSLSSVLLELRSQGKIGMRNTRMAGNTFRAGKKREPEGTQTQLAMWDLLEVSQPLEPTEPAAAKPEPKPKPKPVPVDTHAARTPIDDMLAQLRKEKADWLQMYTDLKAKMEALDEAIEKLEDAKEALGDAYR